MTRLGYGALRLNKEWADLREIAGRALRRLERVLAHHKVALDVPPDLPTIRVDPVLIEQVLVNLLDNAAKYSPQGSRISVSAQLQDNTIVAQVGDQGAGIPADAREAVFDVFYRLRGGDREAGGSGLGLSICRGLIEAHGGRIVAKAGPRERGTVIEFSLPLEPVPEIMEEGKAGMEGRGRD